MAYDKVQGTTTYSRDKFEDFKSILTMENTHFCHLSTCEKEINLPEFLILGLINYILMIVNMLGNWKYVL